MACRRAAGLARRGAVSSYLSYVTRAPGVAVLDGSIASQANLLSHFRKCMQPGFSCGNEYVTASCPYRFSLRPTSVAFPSRTVNLQFTRTYASDLPPHQEIGMPSLSPTMTQGNISTWKKKEGDQVAAGDVLCEIETDKATLDMESMEEGYLAKIVVGDGAKDIKVGEIICVMVEEKDDIESFKDFKPAEGGSPPSPPKEAPPPPPPASESPSPPPPPPKPTAPPPPSPKPSTPPPSSEGRIFASPAAKKLASEKNVPLSSIKGTGPEGHILKADIEDFLASGGAPAPQKTAEAPSLRLPVEELDYTDIPNNQIKRVTARRLLQSKQTIPHYYLSLDTRVDKLLLLREQLNESQLAAKRKKLSLNDFVIKAAALATRKVPECNSSWTDDFVRQYRNVNISVAVQTDQGLMVPVVKDADRKGLSAISEDVKVLADKARSNSLKPSDYEGGTFTVSNLGGPFGIKQFSAVINPPQACILAVGTTEKRVIPGPAHGEYLPGTFMTVTLSCDHRIVDGAIGAQWLGAFKGFIEDPMTLLL